MKIFTLCSVLLLSVWFWQTKKARLSKRVDSLRKIREFILNVSDEIRSSRKDIFDIISADKTGLGLFSGVVSNGRLLYDYYLEAKEKSMRNMCLEAEDESVFDGFFRDFGSGDASSQIRICSEAAERIDRCLKTAEEKRSRYGRLYTVAGISMGSFIVIMLL